MLFLCNKTCILNIKLTKLELFKIRHFIKLEVERFFFKCVYFFVLNNNNNNNNNNE
jgi:hypothetical protein